MTNYVSNLGRQYVIRQEPTTVGSDLYLGYSHGTVYQLSFIFKKVQKTSAPPTQRLRKHENVLHFDDWIDYEAKMERYLIYPTFDGVVRRRLSDYVKDRPDPSTFRTLIHHLLGGLSYCHKYGITHGRVEPSTLLIEQLNMQPYPTLILTYDLSREFANPLYKVAPGPYSPPEVWPPVVWPSEPSEQDLRSVDSWACGCVLVYIHTGHHLIDPTREMESMESIKAMKDSGAHLSLPVKDLPELDGAYMDLLNGFLRFDPLTRLKVVDAYNNFRSTKKANPAAAPESEDLRGRDFAAHFPVGDITILPERFEGV